VLDPVKQPLDLFDHVHLQMRLENIGLDADGQMLPLAPDGEPVPLVIVARTADGCAVRFTSAEIPSALRLALMADPGPTRLPEVTRSVALLRPWAGLLEVGHYRTYLFP